MSTHFPDPHGMALAMMRHGATRANQHGLRCGGDLDLPLTDAGRRQVELAARQLHDAGAQFGLIITSDLRRTRESAEIVARALPGLRIVVEPVFAERRLGAWNLCPIDETEAALVRGDTPPGGESNADFIARVRSGLRAIEPLLAERPLLVGSKGIARAIRTLLGLPRTEGLHNAELAQFDLTPILSQPAVEALA